jgi:hypothetical protein
MLADEPLAGEVIMSIREIGSALRAEVGAKRNQKRFEAAKQHQPELLEHETVLSVLAVLGDGSKGCYAEKEALTRALLCECKREPHPFWNAVLCVAYYPMLARLRWRIRGDAIDPDDLDQIVISAFLEVVRDFPLSRRPDRTCMFLRQKTERRVFKRVRTEQRDLDRVRPDDPANISRSQARLEALGLPARWPETEPDPERWPDPIERAAQVSFLAKHAGDVLDGDKLELVATTLVQGEVIRTYVDRVHPSESPLDRRRAYQRIKRRHSRTIARIREALGELRADLACLKSRVAPTEHVMHLGFACR